MAKRGKQFGPRTPQQEQGSRGVDFLGSAFRVEDILAINLPPDVRRRTRITRGGKIQRRYTLEIETEPVFHDLNEERMGRGAAETLAEVISDNLRNSSRQVKEATRRYRRWAEKVYYTGRPQKAKIAIDKRYAGGRIGETPPRGESTQYGVDSGRLADGLFARIARTGRTGQRAAWHINVPANRLNRGDEFWGGSKAMFDEWLTQFRQLANISGAVASLEFQSALYSSLAQAIGTLQASIWRKKRARLRQQWKVVRGFRLLAVV
jgi:hypothetical protein